MLNWIKYLPLEWRKQENDCIPGGPDLASAKRVSMVVGGSRLTLHAPRHRPASSDFGQARPPSADILSRRLSSNYGEGFMANRHWGFTTLLDRSWAFWGPWMTGAKAQLTLGISLVGRNDSFAYEKDISFFHPKAFENALVDYLNDRYGHEGWSSGKPRYVGPVAWRRHFELPVFSATFEIYEQGLGASGEGSLHERLFVFPITPSRFVEVVFERGIYQLKNGSEPDFDITPVDELEKAIFNSFKLELSPSAQAEWDKVKAECDDMNLSETFPPLRWPTNAFVPEPMDPEFAAHKAWLEKEFEARQHLEQQAGHQ